MFSKNLRVSYAHSENIFIILIYIKIFQNPMYNITQISSDVLIKVDL
jgi:hypothetical protein